MSWTELLRRKDAAAGRQMGTYGSGDLSFMLRAMTERLGEFGFPFSRHLSRPGQNYASELREVRHRWAHNETFTAEEAYRAIDSVELLLRAIGAAEAANETARLKTTLIPLHSGVPTPDGQSRPADLLAPSPTEPADQTSIPSARFAPSQARPVAPPASTTPAAQIEIHAISDLSYPMAHCRIPVVDDVTIDGVGQELRGAVLQVDVVSAEGSHGGPRELHVDIAAAKPAILREINLALDPASMLTVKDQRPGRIEAVLRDAWQGHRRGVQ